MKKTISVRANGKEYEIPNSWELLTSEQFLKLVELLPLMESGLYPPGAIKCLFLCYLMNWDLKKIKKDEKALENFMAIALNFTAVNNFLFSKTEFSLLTQFAVQPGSCSITTDATDALYDLSKDGLGNARQVEQMNVLTYLRILRKKTIDGVKSLKASGMEVAKIATEVGLPIDIINKIV